MGQVLSFKKKNIEKNTGIVRESLSVRNHDIYIKKIKGAADKTVTLTVHVNKT